jgi:hypothetical protein
MRSRNQEESWNDTQVDVDFDLACLVPTKPWVFFQLYVLQP